jgi:hypothetical protein
MRSRKQHSEIPQDLTFHRGLWAAQRVGWVIALLIIALALLGLFGEGPLSSVRSGDPSLTIEYDRFVRRDSPSEIRIDAQPSAENEIRIAFTRDYIHSLRVDSILPYPQRVETIAEDVVFVFRVAPQTPSARITINAMPLNIGSLQGSVRNAGNKTSIPIDQFVWP